MKRSNLAVKVMENFSEKINKDLPKKNTGSNSAHVLLNYFNELRKIDKMHGLPRMLSLFRNEFNKFNNTGSRTLDSIYHMTLKLLCNH